MLEHSCGLCFSDPLFPLTRERFDLLVEAADAARAAGEPRAGMELALNALTMQIAGLQVGIKFRAQSAATFWQWRN